MYLTELKAAAIDTVAARADAEGARVVFVRNRPVGLDARPRRRAAGAAAPMPETVVVHRGHGLPYSKGLMSQTLSATGLSPQRAFELARAVERRLDDARRGRRSTWLACARWPRRCSLEHEDDGAVRRYRDWHRLDRLDRPLIVMIGGAAGVGKSTLATMLAHRLGITRVIATDVIRQVLRAFFTPEAMPAVHPSAFEMDLDGFREQAEHVDTAVAAIVERACARAHADRGRGRARRARARSRGELRGALRGGRGAAGGRGRGAPPGPLLPARAARPAERYLARFDEIRALQAHLVENARAESVAVIDNVGVDDSLRQSDAAGAGRRRPARPPDSD